MNGIKGFFERPAEVELEMTHLGRPVAAGVPVQISLGAGMGKIGGFCTLEDGRRFSFKGEARNDSWQHAWAGRFEGRRITLFFQEEDGVISGFWRTDFEFYWKVWNLIGKAFRRPGKLLSGDFNLRHRAD